MTVQLQHYSSQRPNHYDGIVANCFQSLKAPDSCHLDRISPRLALDGSLLAYGLVSARNRNVIIIVGQGVPRMIAIVDGSMPESNNIQSSPQFFYHYLTKRSPPLPRGGQ